MISWLFLLLSCGKVATIDISQLFAVFRKLASSISHVWGSSVVNEAAQEGPCALTSNANVSTMLFKVSDWPERHSSLVFLSQWQVSANLKESCLFYAYTFSADSIGEANRHNIVKLLMLNWLNCMPIVRRLPLINQRRCPPIM